MKVWINHIEINPQLTIMSCISLSLPPSPLFLSLPSLCPSLCLPPSVSLSPPQHSTHAEKQQATEPAATASSQQLSLSGTRRINMQKFRNTDSSSWVDTRATFCDTWDGYWNHGTWLAFAIASYLRYLELQMCEKSLGLSLSLNKMAAAASLQDLTVVWVLVASLFLDALGDTIYWSYWR